MFTAFSPASVKTFNRRQTVPASLPSSAGLVLSTVAQDSYSSLKNHRSVSFGALTVKKTSDSPVSDSFERSANHGLKFLPSQLRDALAQKGCVIQLGKKIVDIFPDLKEATDKPRGYADDASWPQVAGLFRHSEGKIYIGLSEYVENAHNSEWSPTKFPAENILMHEVGHAFDYLLSQRPDGKKINQNFAKAYLKDYEQLSEQDKKEFDYYIQPDEKNGPTVPGCREAFAESFAVLQGAGIEDSYGFRTRFPRSEAFVQKQLQEFKAEFDQKQDTSGKS